MIVESLIAELGWDLKNEADLRRFKTGMKQAESGLLGLAAAAVRAGAVIAAAVGAGLAAVGKSAVTVGADFQDLKTTLEVIEGSSAKAQQSLDWVSKFATETPFELKEVSDAFVRLRSYGLDPTTGLLKSVGDASSAMGKTLMQGVEAIADAVTGENERLKEFGIRAQVAGDKITYSWTENGKSMKKTVKKDAIEIQKAIAGIFDAKFFGMMQKRSADFRGIMSNISDMWQRFLLKVADSGWFKWVQDQFSGLLDWFKEMDADGTLDRWATNVSDALVGTGKALVAFGRTASEAAGRVYALFGRLGAAAARSAEQMKSGDWRGAAKTIVAAIAAEFANLKSMIAPYADQMVAAFKAGLDKLPPEVSSAIQSAIALAKEGDWAGAGIMAVEAYSRYWSALSTAVLRYVNQALDAALTVDWSGLSDRVVQGFAGLSDKIVPAVSAAVVSALESLGSIDTGSAVANAGELGTKMGKLFVESFVAQVRTINGVINTIAQDIVNLDWSRSGKAWFEAMKAQVSLVKGLFTGISEQIVATIEGWFNIDLTGIGVRWAGQLLDGLSSMGGAIRDWFASLLPEWATGFFANVESNANATAAGSAAGALVPDPTDAASRRVHQAFSGGSANDNADLVAALNRFVAGVNSVSGPDAAGKAMADIQQRFDNSVTVGDINTPVSVTINSNNPQATAGRVGQLARSHADKLTAGVRSLGVTGLPSYGGPR